MGGTPPGYPPGGVDEALEFLRSTAIPQLSGMSVMVQEEFDMKLHEIDGTPNFARMGGNSSTVLSIACAKAAAETVGLPLYRYLGGAHNATLHLRSGEFLEYVLAGLRGQGS